jgi:hypothetical protein
LIHFAAEARLTGPRFGREKQPLKPPVLWVGPPLEESVRSQPVGNACRGRAVDAESPAEFRPCLPVDAG